MKILLFLFCTATLFASEKNPIKSSIKAVTVYTENASIKREATVKLIPGSNELRFNNLSQDDTLSKTFFYVVKFPKHKNISL